MRFLLVCLLALTLSIQALGPVSAQSLFGVSGGPETSDDALDGLAQTLRDAAEQGVSVVVVDSDGNLIVSGGAPAKEEVEEDARESVLVAAQKQGTAFRKTLLKRLEALPDSMEQVAKVLRKTSPTGKIKTWVEILVYSLLLFVWGQLVSHYVYGGLIARRFVVSRVKEAPEGFREKMPFLVLRFLVAIVGTGVAMLVAYVTGSIMFPPVSSQAVQITILAIYVAFFACSAIGYLWRMLLSPYLTQYRIPHFSDRDALVLYRWAFVVASLDICVSTFATWIQTFGLNYNVYAIGYAVLAAVMALLNMMLVLCNRRAISSAIRLGRSLEDVAWLTRVFSRFWAPVLIVYIVFGWLELAFDLILAQPLSVPLFAGTYVVFLTILVVYGVINYALESYFERARRIARLNAMSAVAEGAEDGEPLPDPEIETAAKALDPERHKMTSFEELARRVSGILAFVAGIYALSTIWGDGGSRMVEEHPWNRSILDIMVISFIGYIVYHAFRIWIDRKIIDEQGEVVEVELGDESGASSASRLATLLPLFRNFMLIIIVVTIVLIMLLELGVNVGPLFAGAGVVGVAVGFGSQSLVRDVFSGAFFLFDDAFRKGEYIDIGGTKGTVENISVRSFQLRHHLGALHTIPFGEIQVLTNYSRDWVIMKLPLRVTYDTDVEKVRKLIKKLGVALLDDPVIGADFIQPLKSQGVIQMEDSAMIIRVKFMTKPGDQWLVRKKVYEEIRALFEREGIKFAHREVTVRLADGKVDNLSPDERDALTAAAQASIEEDMMDMADDAGDDR